jgi:type I restriction enzyme, S subunit
MRSSRESSIRLKYLFSERIGGAWGNEPYEGNSIVCIRAADFDTNRLVHKTTDLTRRSFLDDEIRNKHLQEGDIIIEKSGGGENQPVGRVVRFSLNETALCSNFLEILRPNKEVLNPEFGAFMMYNLWISRSVTTSIKQTTGIQNLDISSLLNIKVHLPDPNTQKELSNSINNQVAYIDRLVDVKMKFIELLVEKRQTLINQAVTRSLNPNVKLKDSGINLLGKVPEHWKVMRLKYLGEICYGLSQPPEYMKVGTPLIRATNIFRGLIQKEGIVYINENEIPESKKTILSKGDIIIVRSGAYTGDSALVTDMWVGAIAGFDMIFRANNLIDPKFIALGLLSPYILNCQLIPLRSRAAQPHLNAEELGSLLVFVPPLNEQKEIIDILQQKTNRIDKLRNATQHSIDLLKERRIALISEAING